MKHHSSSKKHPGMQIVTLCISTTMVLVLLGLVVLSLMTARNLSAYIREHLTVTVVLNDSVGEPGGRLLARRLAESDFVRQAHFISKEQALKEQTEAMGADPSEFLGTNPFAHSIELQVASDYANSDSLKTIAKMLRMNKKQVAEVAYQEDLTSKVNHNLQQLLTGLIVLAVLLMIICYSLISNSVRLSVYSKRFTIHTMKLVGASWAFIRRPFIKQSLGIWIVSSVMAMAAIAAVVYALYAYQPGIEEVIGVREVALTAASVLILGLAMMMLCTLFSVNKFLRMKAGELYKI